MESKHTTRNAHPEPIYLRTPAAAARLGLSPATLEKMRVRGDGPRFVRLSRKHITYAAAALDDWAQEREYQSTREYSGAV
jgi:predicted DNA-binding transcriptional regulator AlpA